MKEIDDATTRSDEGLENASNKLSGATLVKYIFGIFMIIVYVGMGVLMYINFFDWTPGWAWLRWVGGTIFVVYGVWRAYRQFVGTN